MRRLLLYLTIPKGAPKWAILDLGAFEMTILLSAANHCIDSNVAYAFVKYPDIIRKNISIPEDEDIVIGIGLGYEMKEAKINSFRPGRVPLYHILTVSGD